MLLYRKHIYWIVGVTAAAVRLAAFLAWRQSPLSCFHLIPGLDMMTHWELGRRLAAGLGIFTPYRFLIAVAGTPPLLTGCQMLGGILTALLATRCAFRLWGNRGTALAAGLLTALYAPALLYECVTLQESLLALLGFAAFTMLLEAHRRHFSPGALAAAGTALGLVSLGRPSALPFFAAGLCWLAFTPRRHGPGFRKRLGWLACGVLLIWLPVIGWNWHRAQWPLPFYGNNFSYLLAVAQSPKLNNWNQARPENNAAVAPAFHPGRTAVGLLHKVPLALTPREIPDNLNYHFLRQHFAPLAPLPGPAAVIPTALAGALLLFFAGCRGQRRDWLTVGYLLTMGICMIAYYPAGRYRLVLYPALALCAVYPFFRMFRGSRRECFTAGVLTLGCCLVSWGIMPPAPRRAADATAWALALEKMQNPPEPPLFYHLQAYADNRQDPPYLVRAITPLLTAGRYQEAGEVLQHFEGAPVWRDYYAALLALAAGHPAETERLLLRIPPDALPEFQVQRWYFLAESLHRQGRPAEAAIAARRGLAANPTEAQRRQLEHLLKASETLRSTPVAPPQDAARENDRQPAVTPPSGDVRLHD